MKRPPLQRRTLALIAVLVPLLVLLAYVALRSGPLAPVAVTETRVESRAIRPALFGIGTVIGTPKCASYMAGTFGNMAATVSPTPTPRCVKADARRRQRSYVCAQVKRCSL